MSDVNRDPVRWERSMTQDKEGQYVAFHDYALLLDAHDTLRARLSEAQARLATKRELLERLRFLCTDLIPDETAEEVRGSTEVDDIISCLIDTTAAPVSPAAQAAQAAQTVAVPDDVTGRVFNIRPFCRVCGEFDGHHKGACIVSATNHPAPATPAKVEDTVARDAARWRFVQSRMFTFSKRHAEWILYGPDLSAEAKGKASTYEEAIDAAMSAAQAQKKEAP